MKTLGFSIEESMVGTHRFSLSSVEMPFRFDITWGTDDIKAAWELGGVFSAIGTISVEGLCDRTSCYGALKLGYFSEGRLRYELFFSTPRLGECIYIGEKVNIKPWNLLVSHTTCFGTIELAESGQLLSRSVSHFRAKDVLKFAKSFKLLLK